MSEAPPQAPFVDIFGRALSAEEEALATAYMLLRQAALSPSPCLAAGTRQALAVLWTTLHSLHIAVPHPDHDE
jgi:hypothetical protein